MKSYQNIEKSGFHKGEYVGHSEGRVFRIRKSNSSFGTWCATLQNDYDQGRTTERTIFAFGLDKMSERLEKLA